MTSELAPLGLAIGRHRFLTVGGIPPITLLVKSMIKGLYPEVGEAKIVVESGVGDYDIVSVTLIYCRELTALFEEIVIVAV